MLRKISFVMVLALLACRSAWAQTTFEFSYANPIYIDVVHTSVTEVDVAGKGEKGEEQWHFLFKLDAGEVKKDTIVCDVTILDCDDVTKSDGKIEQKDMLKGFKNQKFEVVISEHNQKIELRKTEAAVKAVIGKDADTASPKDKKMLQNMMRQVLQNHFGDALVPLPGKPVESGDTWNHTSTSGIPGVAEIVADRQFMFQGMKQVGEKDVGIIEWTSKIDFELKKTADVPFTIAPKAGVAQKNEGSIVWDFEAKRPSKVENEQSYHVEMTMDVGGKKNKLSIKSQETFVFTYHDKKPGK